MLKKVSALAANMNLLGGSPVPGLVLLAALAVVIPPLLADYWVFLVTAGLLTTITAMGLAIIVGWVGEVTLAGAGLLGASVYVTGYFYRVGESRLNGWPFIPAALVGILFAAFLSGLVAIPTARFSGIYVMVLTPGSRSHWSAPCSASPGSSAGSAATSSSNRPRFPGALLRQRPELLLPLPGGRHRARPCSSTCSASPVTAGP